MKEEGGGVGELEEIYEETKARTLFDRSGRLGQKERLRLETKERLAKKFERCAST